MIRPLWIRTKSNADIYVSYMMYSSEFGDSLTSSSATWNLIFLAQIEMSQQPLNGLPWNAYFVDLNTFHLAP